MPGIPVFEKPEKKVKDDGSNDMSRKSGKLRDNRQRKGRGLEGE